MVGRMPIPSIDDWRARTSKQLDVLVKHGNDFVTVSDWKGSARAEIVLDVYYDQSRVAVDLDGQFCCNVSWDSTWKIRIP